MGERLPVARARGPWWKRLWAWLDGGGDWAEELIHRPYERLMAKMGLCSACGRERPCPCQATETQ